MSLIPLSSSLSAGVSPVVSTEVSPSADRAPEALTSVVAAAAMAAAAAGSASSAQHGRVFEATAGASSDLPIILEQLTEEQRRTLQELIRDKEAGAREISLDDGILERLLLLWQTPAAALAMENTPKHLWERIDYLRLRDFICEHPEVSLEVLQTAIDKADETAIDEDKSHVPFMKKIMNILRACRVSHPSNADFQAILGQLTEEQRRDLQPFLDNAIKALSLNDALDRLFRLWPTPAAALAMGNTPNSVWRKIAESPALLSRLYRFVDANPEVSLDALQVMVLSQSAGFMQEVVDAMRGRQAFARCLSPDIAGRVNWNQIPSINAAERLLPASTFQPSSIPEDPSLYPTFFEGFNLAKSDTSSLQPGPPCSAGEDLAALLSNRHSLQSIEFRNLSEAPISIQVDYSDGTQKIFKIQRFPLSIFLV